MSRSPTFSSVCGGRGDDHSTFAGVVPAARESSVTCPRSSRRTKSLQLRMCSTLGHRCVCSGTVSPRAIRVSRTRTSSFSSSRTWCFGAATTASSESGHAHGAVFAEEVMEWRPESYSISLCGRRACALLAISDAVVGFSIRQFGSSAVVRLFLSHRFPFPISGTLVYTVRLEWSKQM